MIYKVMTLTYDVTDTGHVIHYTINYANLSVSSDTTVSIDVKYFLIYATLSL